jgi:DNA-binding transcriptional regulator YdaS (Cro superfamily)
MKTLDDVLTHFGGTVKLADALGIKHQAISQWRGGIPVGRAFQIQVLTKGKIKAKELRQTPQDAPRATQKGRGRPNG